MSTSDSFFDDHGSSVIDTLSADSVLTTVPCTEIPEVSPRFVSSPVIDEALKSRQLNLSSRFKHRIPGWSPDVVAKMAKDAAAGDSNRNKVVSKLPNCHPKNSSVYMMNYENTFPESFKKPRKNVGVSKDVSKYAKSDPPNGFAIPLKPSVSTFSEDGVAVFSPAQPVYRLKANPVHQASFYKSVAETVESLDSHEMQRGIWVNPNSSPFFSILHLSCRVGGITAVNMTTGESVRKSLSIQSFNQTESEAQSSSSTETLVDEPTKIERNLSKAAQLKADLNLAWDEVCAELDKIERLFVDSSDVDLSSETEQCQRKVFGVYSPVKPSTYETTSVEDSEVEEDQSSSDESEMQLMSPELQIQTKNLKCFDKMLERKYPKNGAIDRWFHLMADEDKDSKIDDGIVQMEKVMSLCENVMQTLTASEVSTVSESVRAASSTSGTVQSVKILRYPV